MSRVPARDYRRELYDRYVTVQHPAWREPVPDAERVWAKAMLRRLQGWLLADTDLKCLDLGCGAGSLMKALRAAGYANVRGVDIGSEATAIAQAECLDVVQTDLRDYLEHSNETYDLIFLLDVIEHFRKDEMLDLLGLIWQRLAPSGACIIQTPNADSPWASHLRYGDFTHEWIFSPHSLASLLRLSGFTNVEVRPIGPTVHGLKSAFRWLAWRVIWSGCAVWNLVETGSINSGVYTRNMVVRAAKDAAFRW